MKTDLRVLAFGWYGAGNMGDELLLDMLKRWCQELGATVSVLSINPAHTRSIHQIEAIDTYDLVAVAHAMQNSDLFVLGGGGLFQTHQTFTISALYRYGQGDISTYARPVLMARQMGLPTLLWAQGVGPLEGDDARQIVRDIFSNATHVSVRDEGSKCLLTEIGVSRDIMVAPDPVWAYPIPKKIPRNKTRKKRIALVIRPWSFVRGWEDCLVDALKNALLPAECTLVWMPFQAIDVPGRSTSDVPFIKNLMQRVGNEYTHEWLEFSHITEIAEALAHCDSVVSMRLHAQILSLKLEKPTLCIEYDSKMSVVSAQVGVPLTLRLTPDAPLTTWRSAFIAWIKQTKQPLQQADELVTKALIQRKVLQQAIKTTIKGIKDTRWQAAQFNWIGAWTEGLAHQLWVERDSQIATLNQLVYDRDQQIVCLNQAVYDRDVQIAGLNQSVYDRDQQIICLNQTVYDRDVQIAGLTHSVSEQNEQIVNLTQTLATRDLLIAEFNKDTNALNDQVINLKQILNEREELIASLNVALHTKEMALVNLKSAFSWRLIRFMKLLIQNPKKTILYIGKLIFWRLPPSIRQLLDAPRRKINRWVENKPAVIPVSAVLTESSIPDLTWEAFQSQILARRDEYKGIFIQELVIDWAVPLYQRPQHIATALGKLGYLVIYKTINWTHDTVNGFRQASKNVWLTNSTEVNTIDNVVRSIYSTAYANTPESLMENGRRGIIVYEYIDHIDPQISGDAENIRRLLAQKNFAFNGGADFVVASSHVLEQEAIAAVGPEKTILVQNGVDTGHYRNVLHQSTPLPENLMAFNAKYTNVIGYFGALAPWLWYEAITELVAKRPDLGFVFIGPDYYGGAEKLPIAENVLYLGTVDYKILPAYARQFDVCFIPFEPGEIARTTSPLKLFEYFALEKPVVVTADMLECIAFKEVFSGNSANTLIQAIDAAIQIKDDAEFKKRLALLADKNDWDQRAKALEAVFFTELFEDISHTFHVSASFVRSYFFKQQLPSHNKKSWRELYDTLNPLQKMYVEFAMTTVIRGRDMASLLTNHLKIKNKRRYLDIGTGYGGFLKAFKEIGFQEVMGVELNEQLSGYAKANISELEFATVLNIDFDQAVCTELGEFDLITCNDVIEHVKQPALTIEKMATLIAKGGYICLEVPNKDCITFVKSDGHFQIFALTLLTREDAATFYAEDTGRDKSIYLHEMGESYELQWYLDTLTANGLIPNLIENTHSIGSLADVPSLIADLKAHFETWCQRHKPPVNTVIHNVVEATVSEYINKLEHDFKLADNEEAASIFIRKYLSAFWTITAIKQE